MAADLMEKILDHLEKNEKAHSLDLAQFFDVDHQRVIGAIKSLENVENLITVEYRSQKEWVLTEEGEHVLQHGSHEAAVYNAINDENGVRQSELFEKVPFAKVGLSKALAASWVELIKKDNEALVKKKVPSISDVVQMHLKDLQTLSDDSKKEYKKRKLIKENIIKTCLVHKGSNFKTRIDKAEPDLTADLLVNDAWKDKNFKPINLNALGAPADIGHLHPLQKMRSEFRKIFLEMGFEEMPTNNYVENSFWNFDALFQPQQHPARDAHDTFFLSNPATSSNFPMAYLEKVKKVHSVGGFGSQGYGYDWKIKEAEKNILRTHTTAVSARMLYKLMQEGTFRPVRYFSIDKVFRNETLDATHLAEFCQVEGVVADYNLTLGDLIGTLYAFYEKLGITELEFKPAYNPYTEPSMEIFCFHKGLGKWIEMGNSGIFRPEMLLPMNLPENVNVIAWGLSLERPTMIKYGLNNIRDLVGPKVDLEMVYNNPLCRLNKFEASSLTESNIKMETKDFQLPDDLVMFCDPLHVPGYLQRLFQLLKNIYTLKLSVHFHMSASTFYQSSQHEEFRQKLVAICESSNNTSNSSLSIVFIWSKEISKVAPIILRPRSTQEIAGVSNVARCLARLIEFKDPDLLNYESSGPDFAGKIDTLLDKIENMKSFSDNEIKKFCKMENLSKSSKFFLGDKMTLVDIFLTLY